MQLKDQHRTIQELKYLDQAFRLMGVKWNHALRRVTHLDAHELPYEDASPKYAAQSVFRIKTKGGGFQTFRAKPAQLRLLTAVYEDMALGLPVFIVILKARQIGFSTAVALLFLSLALIKSALDIIVAAHIDKSASKLFEIYKTAYRFLPDELKPPKEKDNQQELKFASNQSQLQSFVAKEGNMGVSTSYTHAHFSEIALWKHEPAETLSTALDSIPKMVGTIVFAESTSRGKGNLLHEMWEKATANWADPQKRGLNRDDPWRPLFFGWQDDEEYYLPVDASFRLTNEEQEFQALYRVTKPQIAWRRSKIQEKAGALGLAGALAHFDRENPSDPETAFRVVGEIVFDAQNLTYQHTQHKRILSITHDAYLIPDKRLPTGHKPAIIVKSPGPLRIYERPKEGHDYLLAVDPTRNEGRRPDDAAMQVIDAGGPKVVASYNIPIDPEDLARAAAAVGWFYNEAFAVVENNDAGLATVRVMYKELGYRNMYRHVTHDRVGTVIGHSLGFPLKGENRDEVIKNGKRFVREYRIIIPDGPTLEEMEAFRAVFDRQRNRYKPQGTGDGKRDNLVMALLMGLYVGNWKYQWFKKDITPLDIAKPQVINEAAGFNDRIDISEERKPSMEALLSD